MNDAQKETQRGYQETLQRFLEALDARNDIDPREPWTHAQHKMVVLIAAASLWHGGDEPKTNPAYLEGQLRFIRTAVNPKQTLKGLVSFIERSQDGWNREQPEPEPRWYIVTCSERVVSTCIVKAPSDEALDKALYEMAIPADEYAKLYSEDWQSEGYEEGTAQEAHDYADRFSVPIIELNDSGDVIARTEIS